MDDLPADPGIRPPISYYHPNDQDVVRRYYIKKGPCQPVGHNYPKTDDNRHFSDTWFKEYPNWLEYSIEKNAAFCLYCYCFGTGGDDTFAHKGFVNWRRKDKLKTHVGKVNSVHNKAYMKAVNLMNEKQAVYTFISRQSDKEKSDHQLRLETAVDVTRLLLLQGLAFRAHDESATSSNRGKYIVLTKLAADHNESIKAVVLENAPKYNILIAPSIQKDIANACAVETTNAILNEFRGSLFSILVDESRDVSIKEQMAVIVRYVDNKGCVIERFLAIVHVKETTAVSLKEAIDMLFSRHDLSISNLRGQGYDGASNMKGEYNGLKTLILKENGSAFFVHCFAYELQLALVVSARNNKEVSLFFDLVAMIVNIAGASCKRRDILRETQASAIIKALEEGDLETGQGLNQETNLKRAGDTRWGSHYGALINLKLMFSSVVYVLNGVMEDGSNLQQKAQAMALLDKM